MPLCHQNQTYKFNVPAQQPGDQGDSWQQVGAVICQDHNHEVDQLPVLKGGLYEM
jgi:hypothetical protein